MHTVFFPGAFVSPAAGKGEHGLDLHSLRASLWNLSPFSRGVCSAFLLLVSVTALFSEPSFAILRKIDRAPPLCKAQGRSPGVRRETFLWDLRFQSSHSSWEGSSPASLTLRYHPFKMGVRTCFPVNQVMGVKHPAQSFVCKRDLVNVGATGSWCSGRVLSAVRGWVCSREGHWYVGSWLRNS